MFKLDILSDRLSLNSKAKASSVNHTENWFGELSLGNNVATVKRVPFVPASIHSDMTWRVETAAECQQFF